MKRITLLAALAVLLLPQSAGAQAKAQTPDYEFTVVKELPITPVKNQYRSGTCWCFSTIGFLESEVIRMKNIKDPALYPDFSEMFVISLSYKDRAEKYVRLDGNLTFGAGSSSDDVLHVVEDYGVVPQQAMPGLQELPVHGELDATTKAYVEAIAKNPNKTLSKNWKKGFDSVVDSFLGECPESFELNGKTYTPASYRDELGIIPSDYVSISSFTHHPFYKRFPLEVADNWRWDTVYNVPIDEFMDIIRTAINSGYTVAWGSDVSEKGFTRDGIGVLLEEQKATSGSDQERWVGKDGAQTEAAKTELPKEETVSQESRQEWFDNKQTTDDHGMLIYGIAKDQDGNSFFMVKNSWGETGKYKGLWYCSETFVRGKSLDIVVHKDALSKEMRKKLGIQ